MFTVLALYDGVLPPTLNHSEPDTASDIDFMADAPRSVQVEAALSNSFGFGGHNSVIAFRRWADG